MEYFNGDGRRSLGHADYPDDPEAQLDCVLTLGATDNGVYGVKLFPAQFDRVARTTEWIRRLPNPVFVLLKRRDLLGQAISMTRALQTEQWRAQMPAKGAARYDGAKIREHLQLAARDYARWDAFFARNGLQPLTLWYEQLVADPQAAVDRVAGLVGLEGRAEINWSAIDVEVQRDALNEQWRARFLDEFRDTCTLDAV